MTDERICTHCDRPVEELEHERQQHEALAASLPEEWVKAAESWYSMHGSGLVRNLLAGAVPLIQAAERERAEAAEGKLTAIAEFCHEQEACPRCGCGDSLVKAAVHILAIIGSGEKGGDPDDDSFDGPVL